MTVQNIKSIFLDVDAFSKLSREELLAWTEKHPYSGFFKSLLLKKDFDNRHPERSQTLENFAAVIPDRDALHDFIHTDWKAFVEKSDLQRKSIIEKKSAEKTETKEKTEAPKATVEEKKVKKETTPAEKVKKERPAPKPKPKTKTKPKKETNIKPGKKNAEPTPQPEKAVGTAKRSFSDWLSTLQSRGQDKNVAISTEVEQPTPEPTSLSEGQKPLPGLDEIKDIEIFRKKQADKKTEKKAEIKELAGNSVTLNDDLITETYARILSVQKKYERAIEAYEKLSLKFPEKSRYFADLIKKLEKKL